FHGGEVVVDFGGLHPALYTLGLLDRARAAGALVAGGTPVTGIRSDGDGFTVATAAGAVRARDVIVATNGYSGPATPWMRRRVIPIGSQLIATEPLAPEVMARVMPKGRMMGDTRKLHHYFRPSPDGRRMVFGGRVTRSGLRATAQQLHGRMVGMFPQLDGVRVTHTWAGKVAFTFDTLPHIGVHGGVHYAMGYCGTGVAMATYLGHKAARRVLGAADAATAFDGLAFPTRPLYTGHPWFLPAALAVLGLRDRMGP
ncbi:MAG: FAD-binding oxidoreductase, partial [Rhodobacterales bacterium]|nr:FAD-binding oxidoreductase [Rhodobacterales bacterium]